MAEAVLGSEEFRVRVRAPASDLAWVCEFFAPGLLGVPGDIATTGREAEEPRLCVELRRDDSQFERLESLPRAELVPVYARDAGYDECVRCSSPDTLLWDPELDVFGFLRPADCEVQVVAREAGLAARVALMRVVRELWLRALVARGARVAHASCCSIGGRGVLIAGAKGAGKSSVATHLLESGVARSVGNDRVALMAGDEGEGIRGLGVATIVAFKPRALQIFPSLRRVAWKRGFLHRLCLAELEDGGPSEWPEDAAYNLSPAQYLHQLGAAAQAATRVEVILFPSIRDRSTGAAFAPIPPAELEARLAAACFPEPGPAFRGFDSSWARAAAPLSWRELGKLAAYECELGRDAYEGDDLVRRIRQLLDAAPEQGTV